MFCLLDAKALTTVFILRKLVLIQVRWIKKLCDPPVIPWLRKSKSSPEGLAVKSVQKHQTMVSSDHGTETQQSTCMWMCMWQEVHLCVYSGAEAKGSYRWLKKVSPIVIGYFLLASYPQIHLFAPMVLPRGSST